MNRHKHIANVGFEEESRVTTRSFNQHGVPKWLRRIKRLRNRSAKRQDAAFHLKTQEA